MSLDASTREPVEAGLYWVEIEGERAIAYVSGNAPFFQVNLVNPFDGGLEEVDSLDDVKWIDDVVFPKKWEDEDAS